MKKAMHYGKNFDDLAPKFLRKVYGGIKGNIRLAVLKKDLSQFFPSAINRLDKTHPPLSILDAGGGAGPFSLKLAKLGHRVTLCDISEKMLEKAGEEVKKKNLSSRVTLIHGAIQELPRRNSGGYDLVLCHAVLEWVEHPRDLISHLTRLLDNSGMLSMTFYNLNGMIFKNMLRSNYKKILKQEYKGWPGSLTPSHPRQPEKVITWLEEQNLKIVCHSGIRVFHDYILDTDDRKKNPETVLDLELKFSRKLPYRDLGRYQHILACRQMTKR